MKPRYAVRHAGQCYEVYLVSTSGLVGRFAYHTEDERGQALGTANAVRNDMNKIAKPFEYDPEKMFPFASQRRLTD